MKEPIAPPICAPVWLSLRPMVLPMPETRVPVPAPFIGRDCLVKL